MAVTPVAQIVLWMMKALATGEEAEALQANRKAVKANIQSRLEATVFNIKAQVGIDDVASICCVFWSCNLNLSQRLQVSEALNGASEAEAVAALAPAEEPELAIVAHEAPGEPDEGALTRAQIVAQYSDPDIETVLADLVEAKAQNVKLRKDLKAS